jgi:hypothetical protein
MTNIPSMTNILNSQCKPNQSQFSPEINQHPQSNSKGFFGQQNNTNSEGPQGPQGPRGPQGPQGPQGPVQKSILYNCNYDIKQISNTAVHIPFNGIKYTLNSVLVSLKIENTILLQLVSPLGIMATIELPKSGKITLEWDSFINVPTSTCTLELQCQCLENIEITSTVIAIELEMNSKN